MPGETSANPGSKKAIFARRLSSTLLLWALVTAVFASGRAWAFYGVIGLLALVASIEFFRIAAAGGGRCFPRFGILLTLGYSLALYPALLGWGNLEPASVDAMGIFVAVVGAFLWQFRHPIRGVEPLLAVGVTVVGFLYIPVFFSFAGRLVTLGPGGGDVPGAWLLLWLVAVTKFTDMGAYAVGSMIGRHKMIPHVSPGKTWEGFAGALAFAQLAGCGLFALLPDQLAALGGWGHVVFLGVALALLAVLGDLAESVIKRSVGAKDSGRFLPGIGGALDLIDSLCFTAPFLYFYLRSVVAA